MYKLSTRVCLILPLLTGSAAAVSKTEDASPLAWQCVAETCGTNNLKLEELAKSLPVPTNFSQAWDQMISPGFEKIKILYEAKISQRKKLLRTWSEQGQPLRLDKHEARSVKLKFLEWKYPPYRFAPDGDLALERFKVDSEKFRLATQGLGTIESALAWSLVNENAKSQEEAMRMANPLGASNRTNILDPVLTKEHPGLPLRQARGIEVERAYSLLVDLEKQYGRLFSQARLLIEQMRSSMTVKPEAGNTLAFAILSRSRLELYRDAGFLKQLDSYVLPEQEMKSLVRKSVDMWPIDFSPMPFPAWLEQCKSELSLFAATRPSPEELRAFSMMSDKVKQVAARVATDLTKDPDIGTQLTRTHVFLPRTWEQSFDELKVKIKLALEHEGKSETMGESIISHISSINAMNPPPYREICHSLNASLYDGTIMGSDSLDLSWSGIKLSGKFGAAIYAHELGHVLTSALAGRRPEPFFSARQCVATRNWNPRESSSAIFKAYSEDSPWTEEDFADYFSSRVMTEAGLLESSQNLGCFLLNLREQHLTWRAAPLDTHSSGFLRLLLIGLDRGDLAPSCQRYLRSLGKPPEALTCGP